MADLCIGPQRPYVNPISGPTRVCHYAEWAPDNATKAMILRCSFCGKGQSDVKKLIAGPSVYICNECGNFAALVADARKNTQAAKMEFVEKSCYDNKRDMNRVLARILRR